MSTPPRSREPPILSSIEQSTPQSNKVNLEMNREGPDNLDPLSKIEKKKDALTPPIEHDVLAQFRKGAPVTASAQRVIVAIVDGFGEVTQDELDDIIYEALCTRRYH